MDLLERFRSHLATLALPSGRALVAVSGGADSLALLDLLVRASDVHGLELVVAHVDHGIAEDSAAVAAAVRRVAEARGLAFESVALGLGPGAGETEARERRRSWLVSTARRLDAHLVFLGHHADDQSETVLMRVLEGTGAAGLAGIPAAAGMLVRPLLPFTRAALREHARAAALPVWDDPANSSPRHLRSWLRAEVLPLLRERLPDVDRRLRRLARAAAAQRIAWDAALDVLPGLEPRLEQGAISVAGDGLRGYDSALSEALLMAAARRVGCPVGPLRAGRIRRLAEAGRSGSRLELGGGWVAEVAFGRVRLAREAEHRAEPPWMLEGEGERRWGRWRLRWGPETAPERQERTAFVAWFRPERLEVRAWRAGDRVKPLAGSGHRPVVRCFQEQKVSRRSRLAWPVLAQGQAVVWVPGVCRSDLLLPPGGTEAVRVDAEHA